MADRRAWRRRLEALAVWLATALLLEVGLRALESFGHPLQQWIGACAPSAETPTPLHHAPAPGRGLQRLGGGQPHGQFPEMEYAEAYDELGIKGSALRPQSGEGTRVLFMGDSFIQGYDDANTVPQRAWEWIVAQHREGPPLIVLNAGYSSYAPLIFTVQAKRLLPALHPDVVVVDVDETDLFDDAVRYRNLAVRDGNGKVIAVDRDPGLMALASGRARARCQPLYLLRLLASLYYEARIALHDWREPRDEQLFAVATAPQDDLPAELQAQMRYFASTLDELFETLTERLPASRILVIRHPHLRHMHANGREPVWNRKVGELVGAAAARHGITIFDAQDELEASAGGHPERYYWPDDMHFNFDGIRAYGDLVGRELQRKLDQVR